MPMRLLPQALLAAVLLFAAGCRRQSPHATVSGYIEGCKDSIIHLFIGFDENRDVKYVPIKDGYFSWTDTFPDPQSVVMEMDNQRIQLFLDNTDVQIDGDINALDRAKITGSAPQLEYEEYLKSVVTLRQEEAYQEAMLDRKDKDENDIKAAGKMYDSLIARHKQITDKFIATHPGSIVSVAIIADLSYSEEPGYLDSLFRLLTPEIAACRDGTQLKKKITDLMCESIGQPLKDFREVNIDGDTVRLADLKGKYVLIHFWEAYNHPEHRELLKLYNCYCCKNFTVLGVWVDRNKEQWKEWVADDELPWNEVSDLRPLDGSMALEFGMRDIADNLLVDPNGIIIGRYLSMRALKHKLETLPN